MDLKTVIARLPYKKPFLFVDELLDVNENGAKGTFIFDENLDFYKGHFDGYPITPGAILTETMAQIGVVCLGIFLMNDTLNKAAIIALTSTEIEFIKPVLPNEKITVISEKIYFRFGKLKCKVSMQNENGETVCNGTIAGLITTKDE